MARFSRRYFLKMSLASLAMTATGGTLGIAYGSEIEPDWLQVREMELTLPRLAPAFDGYRLVQITDLHIDDGMTPAMLRQVVKLINQQQPDLIAITGDFVSANAEGSEQVLRETLLPLRAKDGVVGVPGNHDYWSNITVIRRMMQTSGIRDLSNTLLTLQRGADKLHIAGVDDIWENHHDLAAVLAQLPDEGAAILLAHEPDFADESAATGRFDLQLSGHSHGGQVVIPFLGPPILPPFAQKYPLGLYRVGEMWQYTNRGLASVLPIRINCRPEITVFTLKS